MRSVAGKSCGVSVRTSKLKRTCDYPRLSVQIESRYRTISEVWYVGKSTFIQYIQQTCRVFSGTQFYLNPKEIRMRFQIYTTVNRTNFVMITGREKNTSKYVVFRQRGSRGVLLSIIVPQTYNRCLCKAAGLKG